MQSPFNLSLGQRLQTLSHATADGCGDRFGEALRKVREGLIDARSCRIGKFLDDLFDHLVGQAATLRRLYEMATDDRVDRVMPVVADRHGELHLVLRDLTRIEAGLRRDDVVERREAESAARREPDAEILGMAVGGAEQPEYDLRFEEGSLVDVRRIAALQKVRDGADAGTAFGFVFARRRNRQGLTAILLGQSEESS